jgi:hypothetical protein
MSILATYTTPVTTTPHIDWWHVMSAQIYEQWQCKETSSASSGSCLSPSLLLVRCSMKSQAAYILALALDIRCFFAFAFHWKIQCPQYCG